MDISKNYFGEQYLSFSKSVIKDDVSDGKKVEGMSSGCLSTRPEGLWTTSLSQ